MWRYVDQTLIGNFGTQIQITSKNIACFDLDHTIIEPSSNKKFSDTADDWNFTTNSMNFLIELNNQNYRIVIITNQKGLKTDNDIQVWKNKLENMYNKLNSTVLF